jgi:hypothetical protein
MTEVKSVATIAIFCLNAPENPKNMTRIIVFRLHLYFGAGQTRDRENGSPIPSP